LCHTRARLFVAECHSNKLFRSDFVLALDIRSTLKDYGLTLLTIVAATIVGWLLHPALASINVALIYLLAVVASATTWGLGPAIMASLLGVLTLDALFVPPYGLVSISAPQDLVTYTLFITVGVITSELGARLRTQVQVARARERQSMALYETSQQIAFSGDRHLILNSAIQQMQNLFGAKVVILLADESGTLRTADASPLDLSEMERAQRVLESGSAEIAHTARGVTMLPLRTAQANLGVLVLRRALGGAALRDERRALDAFATQIAVALEHIQLNALAEQARERQANERFQEALLSSLSHDLRTPITAITGAATSLRENADSLTEPERAALLQDVIEQSARLNRLVSNLLEMTRLESGIEPQRAWQSIPEVIDAAANHFKTQAHRLDIHCDADVPFVQFDFVLIEQVLVNLIENALKFSPADAPVEIRATLEQEVVQIQVLDRGAGIPPQDLERVFEKFYRAKQHGQTQGSGLGLMICRGIVQAHGGKVYAAPREGGGTRIVFTLPAAERVKVE